MNREERHKIFKEELYAFATDDKLNFKARIMRFKDEYPDITNEERSDPHISRGELRKFIRDNGRSY